VPPVASQTYEDLKQTPVDRSRFELLGKGKYYVRECFYSLQGEGVRAGTANVFLRFSLCNLNCNKNGIGFDCDTNFAVGDAHSLEQVVELVRQTDTGDCWWVLLTGGEPALQLDRHLIEALKRAGYKIAIETNGTIELVDHGRDINWICVSPKTRSEFLLQREANEVKYVLIPGLDLPPLQMVVADHHLISPGFQVKDKVDPRNPGDVDRETLDWCIQKCLENPLWRMSCQQHKFWRVR